MHASPLPSQQHDYPGRATLSEAALHTRRETIFLLFAGLFLGTLAMLNILGITRFLDAAFWIPGSDTWELKYAIAVGVLPYPVTFLCTDFISELYGRTRANRVVFMGLVLNIWVVFILWLGGVMPGFDEISPNGGTTFFEVRELAFMAVTASMIAYLAAQFIDVQLFHFWKHVTRGRHLWLRNNASTIASQLVDTVAVIMITFGAQWQAGSISTKQLLVFIMTGYAFKLVVALLDTVPFYLGVGPLRRYLRLPPATS